MLSTCRGPPPIRPVARATVSSAMSVTAPAAAAQIHTRRRWAPLVPPEAAGRPRTFRAVLPRGLLFPVAPALEGAALTWTAVTGGGSAAAVSAGAGKAGADVAGAVPAARALVAPARADRPEPGSPRPGASRRDASLPGASRPDVSRRRGPGRASRSGARRWALSGEAASASRARVASRPA